MGGSQKRNANRRFRPYTADRRTATTTPTTFINNTTSTSGSSTTNTDNATTATTYIAETSTTNNATASTDSSNKVYKVQIPDHIASRREEIERRIKESLEKEQENEGIVRGLKRLSNENRLDQVISGCNKILCENQDRQNECENKIHDYLQQELNVRFKMRDGDVRNKELGDVLFYYVLRGEKLDSRVREIILRINNPRYRPSEYDRCGLSDGLAPNSTAGSTFSTRLHDHPSALEYLTYIKPQLLFNLAECNNYDSSSLDILVILREHRPFKNFHHFLMNNRNNQGQTYLFYTSHSLLATEVYRNHTDELCELLSIRDVNGQTALHDNTFLNLYTLLCCMTFTNQNKLYKLLTIEDNRGKTVYDIADDWKRKQITWMKNQIENKQYPLYFKPQVLILYNTEDRPGAEEEARSIHEVFEQIYPYHCTAFEKMKEKEATIKRIKTAANNIESGLIVILMSHGNVGTIDDCEGTAFPLSSIEEVMCSEKTEGRPKILITQCCQIREKIGEHLNPDQSSSSADGKPPVDRRDRIPVPYVPVHADFCAIQSSVSGQPSERGVFIPYLADHIKRSGRNERLDGLVKAVIQQMKEEGKTQIPIMQSTLQGEVCIKAAFHSFY